MIKILIIYLLGIIPAFILVCRDFLNFEYDVTIKHIRNLPKVYLLSWIMLIIYVIASLADFIDSLDDIVIFKKKKHKEK